MTTKKAKAPVLGTTEAFCEPRTYYRTDFVMKDSTQPFTAAIPGLSIPFGARAVLVTDVGDGTFAIHPVAHGKSVLNVQTDLLDHLNHFPLPDQYLQDLRDYCDGRLAARQEAKETRGIVIPRERGRWEIAHIQAFQPMG
ncbi:MAG: hypothetical protein WA955_15590 [Diaphorobacter nitroreducens]|uniref:hypothetical protein n=1 Tax=Diaphorobacter nitroreducens TaxID=164759 RepID=UPI003C7676A7